ncbi:MAG: MFS transporter [Dehalococcoidia bacterium]
MASRSSEPHPVAEAPVTPNPRRHLIFVLLASSMLVFNSQFGMVSVALGPLTVDLDAPLRWSGWVVTVFMLALVVSMPVAGRLAERFGARTMFVTGFAIFSVASVACALAPNIYWLILARAAQGAAGGSLQPAGTSIIGEVYRGESRVRAIGLYASTMPFAAVFGPVVGGIVVEWYGWRTTFGMAAPAGLVACVLALLVLPAGTRRPIARLDFPGIALIGITITALVLALTELGQHAVTPDARVVGAALLVFVVGAVVLVWHERRTPAPVLDLDLLSRRPFVATNILSLCFGAGWMGVVSIVPLFAQLGYGIGVAQSGTLAAPRGLLMVSCSALSSLVVHRTGFKRPILFGLLGLGSSLIVLGLGLHDVRIAGVAFSDFWWLMLVIGSAGIFFGFANPSLNNAGIEVAPDRIAAIVGLRGMFNNLGGTLGVAVAVLIASRTEDTVQGLQAAYYVLGGLVIAAAVFVPWIPEMRRATRGREAPGRDEQEAAG